MQPQVGKHYELHPSPRFKQFPSHAATKIRCPLPAQAQQKATKVPISLLRQFTFEHLTSCTYLPFSRGEYARQGTGLSPTEMQAGGNGGHGSLSHRHPKAPRTDSCPPGSPHGASPPRGGCQQPLTISCSSTLPSLVSLMSPAPDTNLRATQGGWVSGGHGAGRRPPRPRHTCAPSPFIQPHPARRPLPLFPAARHRQERPPPGLPPPFSSRFPPQAARPLAPPTPNPDGRCGGVPSHLHGAFRTQVGPQHILEPASRADVHGQRGLGTGHLRLGVERLHRHGRRSAPRWARPSRGAGTPRATPPRPAPF